MNKSTALVKSLKLVIALCGFISLGLSSTFAADDFSPKCQPTLWLEVKKVADRCLDQIEQGAKCDQIQFFRDGSASFRLKGHEYRVDLLESRFSDGGDLNDLVIRRDDGCELERTAIPAFGNLLKALSR